MRNQTEIQSKLLLAFSGGDVMEAQRSFIEELARILADHEARLPETTEHAETGDAAAVDPAPLLRALEDVAARTTRLIHELRLAPAEAERRRLATLLGRTSNRLFQAAQPVYPSNLLDVVVAWLQGHTLGGGYTALEGEFRAALADAERQLAEEDKKRDPADAECRRLSGASP